MPCLVVEIAFTNWTSHGICDAMPRKPSNFSGGISEGEDWKGIDSVGSILSVRTWLISPVYRNA